MNKLNADTFIQKAKLKHGNKYDYSKVNYINSLVKVTITCPIHGDFLQSPNRHLFTNGCLKCGIQSRLNKVKFNNEIFIKKSKDIHGNKYNYNKVAYIDSNEKVIITCPIHGDFSQKPSSHLSGTGCHKCYFNTRKLGTDTFIQKSIETHGNKYNYNKTNYHGAMNKVTITCPIHGDFEQIASEHIYGSGCIKCNKEEKNNIFQQQFIDKSNIRHNNKYDYSKVTYSHAMKKVTITCPVHGDFLQQPSNHLNGAGCSKCFNERRGITTRSNSIDFIKKAKLIHIDKYDYSKVNYCNWETKVDIICKKHGIFKQTPNSHLNGSGCPRCSDSKGERIISKILDNNNISYVREYRIPNQIYRYRYDFYLPDYNRS